MQVRNIAIAIMAAGFGFVFYAVYYRNIDLLLDPVGYLLVFNALRPLKKLQPRFAGGPALSLALVGVSAAALFVRGAALPWLLAAQALLLAALLLVVGRGLWAVLRPKRHAVALAAAGLLAANAAATLFFAFYGLAAGAGLPAFAAPVLLLLHTALFLLLLFLAVFLPQDGAGAA